MPTLNALAASATQESAPSTIQSIAVPTPGTGASAPLIVGVMGVPSAPTPAPHWSVYLTPAVAVIAACIAASIQWRQSQIAKLAAHTAKSKLKLDLFERRFVVFQAAAQLVVLLSEDKVVDQDVVVGLMGKMAGIEFLFDAGTDDYVVNHIFKHLQTRMSLQYRRAAASQANNRTLVEQLNAEFEDVRNWFDNQLPTLTTRMRPFLQLEH